MLYICLLILLLYRAVPYTLAVPVHLYSVNNRSCPMNKWKSEHSCLLWATGLFKWVALFGGHYLAWEHLESRSKLPVFKLVHTVLWWFKPKSDYFQEPSCCTALLFGRCQTTALEKWFKDRFIWLVTFIAFFLSSSQYWGSETLKIVKASLF